MVNVLYQDDYLMVLDKPPGLVVTSSETQAEKSLQDILINDYQIKLDRGGIVHRLDKDTSGALIVAKTTQSLENLQSQFKERVVKKVYICLVHGEIKEKGKIKAPIGRNPGNREKFVVFDEDEGDNLKTAETDYEPIEIKIMSDETKKRIFSGFNKIQFRKLESSNYSIFTLLNMFPLTGRTHQIRVHLKYIGFPIVGDEKYGGRKTVRLDHRWCRRQFLHAKRIEFKHPGSGEWMSFESKLPADLKEALDNLENIKHGTL